jgi:hypothetical protein
MSSPTRKQRKDKKQLSPYESELSQKLSEKGKIGGGSYSESSIKNYVSKYRLAFHKVHPDKVFKDDEWTKDFEEVIKKLNEPIATKDGTNKDPSVSQLSGFYNAIIMIASLNETYPSDIMTHYETIRDKLKKDANVKYAKGGTEKKQKVLEAVSKDDIEKMLKELRLSKDRKERMIWLMMKLTILFSLRNEIGSVKWSTEKDPKKLTEGNWIILGIKKYILVRNDYKTSAKYGMKINDITDRKLLIGLSKWRKEQKIQDGELLFTAFDAGRKAPLKSYDISHYFTDLTQTKLGHKISSSLLYSIYSATPDDLSKATLEDTTKMKEQADNRGHQLKTKLSVYDK